MTDISYMMAIWQGLETSRLKILTATAQGIVRIGSHSGISLIVSLNIMPDLSLHRGASIELQNRDVRWQGGPYVCRKAQAASKLLLLASDAV